MLSPGCIAASSPPVAGTARNSVRTGGEDCASGQHGRRRVVWTFVEWSAAPRVPDDPPMARVCVLRAFFVPDDVRVRREINALADAGHEVTVICMRSPGRPLRDRYGTVDIHRLPMTHRRGGIARYAFEYLVFPLLAALYLAVLDRRRRFDLVQVNTIPDWLVFAALAPRLRGVPVVLDLHELMPEFFASKFGTTLRHPGVRALAWLEQASIRFAHAAVTCTEEMRAAFVSRGADPDRITVVMNSAEEAIFDPEAFPPRSGREAGRFSLICHGTIEERYGLDTIIRALRRLDGRIPELTLEIYGEGTYVPELRGMVEEFGLAERVSFNGFVPVDELVAAIADADAGIVAMKRDPFRDLTQCNKMFDLITMRRPVICSRTTSVMASFPDDCLHYFDADDDADLARAIEEVFAEPELGDRLVERAEEQNQSYRWLRQRERYLELIEHALA
jgi:glycosyltransferase involved in cell wall biosynthesis